MKLNGDVVETSDEMKDMDDMELLANIGYKQELNRSFGLVSMVGFCFSILSCWTALGGSLGEVMLNGGPVALFYGWVGVSVLSLAVAVSMSEICSAYPVAGGQYSWCLLLAKETKWGRAVSYICGWIQLAGLICMGSTSLYQFGLMVGGMSVLNSKGESFDASNWRVVLFCYADALFVTIVNLFGNSLLHLVSTTALWWSIGGFVVCTITILAMARKFQSAAFVFTQSITNVSGWNNVGMSIILGCLQPAYGMCCYDAPAHMAEELQYASKEAPRAIVLSVIIGAVTGIGFILALLFSIQDLELVINTPTGFPLLEIFNQATNKNGAMCLVTIVLMSQVFSAISLLSEGSRSIYAFARDGGFPFKLNDWLMKVDPKFEVPIYAVLVCIAFQAAFIAILFGSSAAFFTVLSIASTGLYVSYLMPIVVFMIRGAKAKAPGYYNISSTFVRLLIHLASVLYLTFCSIFFFFPTSLPVDGNTMNYCIVAFGIVAVFGLVSWFGGARHTYAQDDIEPIEGVIDTLHIVQTHRTNRKIREEQQHEREHEDRKESIDEQSQEVHEKS